MAVRLCKGWSVSPGQLIYDLTGRSPVLPKRHAAETVFTIDDMRRLVEYARRASKDWHAYRAWLTDTLNTVNKSLPVRHDSGMDEARVSPGFDAADIERVLTGHPLFSMQIHYPPFMGVEKLKLLFQGGGLLTFTDVDAYLKCALRGGRENPTIAGEEVEDTGEHRVLLEKLFALDEQLKQNGFLVALFWEASLFHETIRDRQPLSRADQADVRMVWSSRDTSLAFLLVKVYRWLQYVRREEDWLPVLRQIRAIKTLLS
jgi:hypothetical protein